MFKCVASESIKYSGLRLQTKLTGSPRTLLNVRQISKVQPIAGNHSFTSRCVNIFAIQMSFPEHISATNRKIPHKLGGTR